MGWKNTGTLETGLEPLWNPAGTPPEPPRNFPSTLPTNEAYDHVAAVMRKGRARCSSSWSSLGAFSGFLAQGAREKQHANLQQWCSMSPTPGILEHLG